MVGLIKRNLRLQFNSFGGVALSLMGAIISFVLYLVFLRQSIASGLGRVPDLKQILDPWLMGGTLTITAITTTANSLGQMVKDRDNGALRDLLLTRPSYYHIQGAYVLSTILIGIVMQGLVMIFMSLYFSLMDAMTFRLDWVLPILIVMILSSVVWTTVNMLLLSFINNIDSLSKFNSIIGTAAGFFACVYMPIGLIPTSAQWLIEFTPAPYNAALFRQILLKDPLNNSFKNATPAVLSDFKESMGIGININGLTTVYSNVLLLVGFTMITIIAILIVTKILKRGVLKRH